MVSLLGPIPGLFGRVDDVRNQPLLVSYSPAVFTAKYCMGQFVQILLLVTVVYLTLILAVKTMFGDYTNLFAIMTAMLLTCMVVLTTAVS